MAHDISKKWRSEDIKTEENLDFSSLLLSKNVLTGLNSSGFVKPSPIQLQAIPMGRCGLDLIVQAKSGTGKTCVFSVIALEGLLSDSKATQVLVLAPTREIAYQIREVINSIGSAFTNLKCSTFIGGLSLNDDKNNLKLCQIAIGTPGRIKHLIELGALKTNSIRLFVLDEADKLLDASFVDSINWIYKKLPRNKQMLALSATYPEELANLLKEYMRNPFFVRLNADQPALIGIKQFYKTTTFHQLSHVAFQRKIDELLELLKQIHFSQCLIFSNSQTRAESLCETLIKNGWPAAFISGAQDQTKRLLAMSQLKEFQCRILVSTDLTSRGIDAENVNLIFNMDVPRDLETYLHRIGRAGRFGSQGLAITLVSKGKDVEDLQDIASKARLEIMSLPRELPDDLWSYIGESMQSLTEELNNEITNVKNESSTKISYLHMPKPTSIQLADDDFDWLNDDHKEVTQCTVEEIMRDLQSFALPDDQQKDYVSEIEPSPKYSASTEKCMKYLEESHLNFWNAVLRNYHTDDHENVGESCPAASVNDEKLVPPCRESAELGVSKSSSASSKINEKSAHKIQPVPDLLTEITASKKRLLEFYQSKWKDFKPEEQVLTNPTKELQQNDTTESVDNASVITESSKSISNDECIASSESSSSESTSDSSSKGASDESSESALDDSSSGDEYYPNQKSTSEMPNSLYRFPNMTNSNRIQRVYHNYSDYLKQMLEWHKQQKG